MAGGTAVEAGRDGVGEGAISVAVGVGVTTVTVTGSEAVAAGVVDPKTIAVDVKDDKIGVDIWGFTVIVGTGMERLPCSVDIRSCGSPVPCRS